MMHISLFSPLLVLLLSLGCNSVSAEFYTKRSGITDLNEGNWRNLVGKGNGLPWIVEFYAPWCGHCQQLKPEYLKMAAKLKEIVNVGAIDCDNKANGGIAQQFGIRGFPTIKVITPDGKAHDYNGARSAASMASFAINFIDSKVFQVTQTSEGKFVSGESELAKVILFSDKPKTTPLYKSLSAQFSKYAKFGEVKKDVALASKYGVSNFPSLFVIPAGETEPKQFQGDMNPESIKTFIKEAIPNYKENDFSQQSSSKSGSRQDKPKSSGGPPKGDYNIKLTAENFESLVLDSDSVWMVEFFAPWCGHCKNLAPEWQRAADSMKGTVKFGAVDATVETVLASRYGIQGYPTIKVFPALKEAKKRHVEDYRGQRTAAAISSFAASHLPSNLVTVMPLQQLPHWVQGNLEKLPSFVLVTAKEATPTLLKALALEFKGQIRVGAILNADQSTLQQIAGGPSELSLPSLIAITGESTVQAYRGPLGIGPLSDFVRHFLGDNDKSAGSGPSTHGSPAAPEKGIAVLDSQDAFDTACLKRLGLCIIAFPQIDNGVWENPSSYEAFEQTAEKLKARPYHFMWTDPSKQREFADAFRLPDDGSTGLVALHPGKKRFAVFVGVFDSEGISEFIDNITRGRIPTSSYSSLPVLQNDLSFDESSTNSTSAEESAFGEDKDSGKCTSKPTDESGSCSMPSGKDEL